MARLTKRISQKSGMTPGQITYVGDERTHKVTINVIDYDQTDLKQFEAQTVEDCFPFRDSKTITWINVTGIHNVEVIRKIGAHFGIHELFLEDIANTGQRPKFEEGEGYFLNMLKMKYWPRDREEVISEQISLITGPNYVISFQEIEGDVFNPVRERIKKTVPRKRFIYSDYLSYSLMDAVVDNYFAVVERLGEKIEDLEEQLIDRPRTEQLQMIHDLKRELALMRKAIWPLREVISAMERSESKLLHKETAPYIRDLYENTIQIIDTVETFRDMVSGLMDIYLSSVSNKMNEVMKVLTIIATVFIPLGFLAGVYGMNFDRSISPFNMPELGMKFGYLLFWGVVVLIGGGLLWFFRRKQWL